MANRSKTSRSLFSGLVDFVTDMNRMTDRMRDGGSRSETEPRSHVNAWTPSMDIAAIKDELVIYAELAGVDDEDVEVTYSAPILTIAGQRRLQDGEAQQATYHTKELSWGRFRRSFTLPQGVQRGDITVALNRGLLAVTVHRYAQTENSAQLAINE